MNEENEFKVNDRRGKSRVEERTPEPTKEAPKAAPQAAPKAESEAPKKVPPPKGGVEFSAFVMSLSTSAAMYLGLIEDAQTGLIQKNLPAARQQIELLELLEYKTQGNLTPEEKNLLGQVLYELKVRYVEALKGGPTPA